MFCGALFMRVCNVFFFFKMADFDGCSYFFRATVDGQMNQILAYMPPVAPPPPISRLSLPHAFFCSLRI